MYTILLGNPELDKARDAPAKTRFKTWWRVIGSAVEHAGAAVPGQQGVSFKDMFDSMDADDEDSTSLAEFLEALELIIENHKKNTPSKDLQEKMLQDAGGVLTKNPNVLTAAQVADIVNTPQYEQPKPGFDVVREFLCPEGGLDFRPTTSTRISKSLMKYIDGPVWSGGRTLTLRKWKDPHSKVVEFKVDVR
jgi:hypothetical protein